MTNLMTLIQLNSKITKIKSIPIYKILFYKVQPIIEKLTNI